MQREMFVRMATAVLHREGDLMAAQHAEAIAVQMDMFAAVLGEASAAAPAPPLTRTPFPSVNPEAAVPVGYATGVPPAEQNIHSPAPVEPSRIILDTRMPPPEERRAAAATVPEPEPVRSLRGAPGRMKVEDLNTLIQQRAPERMVVDVPMEDGTPRRVLLERNIISRHAQDCVALLYAPTTSIPSQREATEVQAVIHVDDLPVDLGVILEKLKAQAIEVIRPKPAPLSAPPMRPPPGGVRHPDDTYKDPGEVALSATTQSIFNSLG